MLKCQTYLWAHSEGSIECIYCSVKFPIQMKEHSKSRLQVWVNQFTVMMSSFKKQLLHFFQQ